MLRLRRQLARLRRCEILWLGTRDGLLEIFGHKDDILPSAVWRALQFQYPRTFLHDKTKRMGSRTLAEGGSVRKQVRSHACCRRLSVHSEREKRLAFRLWCRRSGLLPNHRASENWNYNWYHRPDRSKNRRNRPFRTQVQFCLGHVRAAHLRIWRTRQRECVRKRKGKRTR